MFIAFFGLIRKSFLIISTILLVGCGGSDDKTTQASSSTAVEGFDLSGTWKLFAVTCFDSSITNMTAFAIPSSSSNQSSEVITGNHSLSETITSASCKVTFDTSMVAQLTSGDSSSGYGTSSYAGFYIKTSTGGTCTTFLGLTMDQTLNSITPSTLSTSYYNNQYKTSSSYGFLYSPPYVYYDSNFSVVGRPSDVCFLVYKKY